jgi:hypothetical protein
MRVWHYQFALHAGPPTRAFYDTDNDGEADIKDQLPVHINSIVMSSEDVYTDAINTPSRGRSGSCNSWLSDVGCS